MRPIFGRESSNAHTGMISAPKTAHASSPASEVDRNDSRHSTVAGPDEAVFSQGHRRSAGDSLTHSCVDATRGFLHNAPVMQARAFWKAVTVDRSDLLDRFIAALDQHGIRYCLIGGQAVNAYVEPVVSLDLVVAAADVPRLESVLPEGLRVERFPHSLNISAPASDLRIQVQTDPRYAAFVPRAQTREVLGLELPVAALEDVLQGKTWAAADPARRASKRQKDLADIARIIEAYPELRPRVPAALLDRLL